MVEFYLIFNILFRKDNDPMKIDYHKRMLSKNQEENIVFVENPYSSKLLNV